MSGIGYNGVGYVTAKGSTVDARSFPSIGKIVEAGCVCNNAELKDGLLYGQPTEGALLSLAAKVCICNTISQPGILELKSYQVKNLLFLNLAKFHIN